MLEHLSSPLSQVQLHSRFLYNLPEWCSGAGGCSQPITVLFCFSFLLAPFFCSRVGSRGCIPVRSVSLLQHGFCLGLQGVSTLLWSTSSSDLGVPSSFLHLEFSGLPLGLFSQRCPIHGWGAQPVLQWVGLSWLGPNVPGTGQPQPFLPVATPQPCSPLPALCRPRLVMGGRFPQFICA